MLRIAVISCSARSRSGVTTAREMYSESPWFRALLTFTSRRFKIILVSSAKYGLVYLQDLITSYDFNIAHKDPTVSQAALEMLPQWGRMVGKQFRKMFPPPYSKYELYLYVGKHYASQIIANVPSEVGTWQPFKHLGQGAQVRFCKLTAQTPLPPQHKAVWVQMEKGVLQPREVTFRVTDKNFAYTDSMHEVLKIPKKELFTLSPEVYEIKYLYDIIEDAKKKQWKYLDHLTPYF